MANEVTVSMIRGPVGDHGCAVYLVTWPNKSVWRYELNPYQMVQINKAFRVHKSELKRANAIKLKADRSLEITPSPGGESGGRIKNFADDDPLNRGRGEGEPRPDRALGRMITGLVEWMDWYSENEGKKFSEIASGAVTDIALSLIIMMEDFNTGKIDENKAITHLAEVFEHHDIDINRKS